MNKLGLAAMAAALMATAGAAAPKTTTHPQAETEALDLAKKAIALRSATGPNNQTPTRRSNRMTSETRRRCWPLVVDSSDSNTLMLTLRPTTTCRLFETPGSSQLKPDW